MRKSSIAWSQRGCEREPSWGWPGSEEEQESRLIWGLELGGGMEGDVVVPRGLVGGGGRWRYPEDLGEVDGERGGTQRTWGLWWEKGGTQRTWRQQELKARSGPQYDADSWSPRMIQLQF